MSGGGIFSIGHSTHPVDVFVDLLKRNNIDVVADVRSSPTSEFNPQFNRENITRALKNDGIMYGFFGKELGARVKDPSCIIDGKVRYDRLAARDDFKRAINRLLTGAINYRIALMCSEKDPLICHRTILVSQALVEAGSDVKHILDDGSLESHESVLDRLFKKLAPTSEDMFMTDGELITETLVKQGSRIAYREKTDSKQGARIAHQEAKSPKQESMEIEHED